MPPASRKSRTCLTCLPGLGPSLPSVHARLVMTEVLVLVDFEGQLSDELKITAGDIIQKVQPGPEEGWLQGELDGRVGIFPRPFVQEIPASLRADGTQRYPRSLRSVHATKKLPAAKQRWCRVTFPYTPTKEDELELCVGDLVQVMEEIEDGWWLGKKNRQLGAFPSNFVEELSSAPPGLIFPEAKVGAMKQRPKMTNDTFVETEKVSEGEAPCYCRAMFDFEPEHDDELRLRAGDLILLLSKDMVDVGWWEGESHGKKGLFPDNFVMPLTHVEPGIESKVPARSKDVVTKPEKEVLQSNKVETRNPGDHKDSKDQKKMDAPKVTVKKAAPPPPVPAKAKPAPSLPHKSPSVPVVCTAAPGGKGKCKEAEASAFDTVLPSTAKLSHPTANRPKMPGKRPPSQLITSQPVKEPSLPLQEESPASGGEAVQTEEQPVSLEDLRTEIQSLRTLMDLMRAQHRRDMEELKMEMSNERSKRAALQAEIEHLKQSVPSPVHL
ncbi:SH3 domain-containing protein 21 [Tiliqua scincoides]|uniref:SH3 domain-containing protein 21 n=1 Tax=Tiliqua scincoides TaxID=71010 RepID=UPI003461B945